VADDLVTAAKIAPGETVLEIGPGLGAVTEILLERGAKVIAVELDEKLAAWLQRQYAGRGNVKIVHADVLKLKLDEIVADAGYKLVSSLPFNITSLVLRNFLERPPRPTSIDLLIQREVAERVTAAPGQMSMLSVSCQYLGRPVIVRTVGSDAFFPEPEVEGAIIHIDVRPLPPDADRERVFQVARIGFSARRKMIANNLQSGLHISKEKTLEILENSAISPTSRPQELRVEDWVDLSRQVV
ncbi:MAG: ribosomal RNA small subunit methyltransferase A, partial [Candidatus Kerfeldbacteria bacterium]|nr:ribosomal RNA small subunit methyltransferase A [Candidatus Kerfeldbacteria bacterium]